MAIQDVAVRLQLLDQLSGPAQRAAENLRKLDSVVRASDASGRAAAASVNRLAQAYGNLSNMAARAEARISSLKGKALGVGVGMLGLALPFKVGADRELAAVRYGQIAGWDVKDFPEQVRRIGSHMTEATRATRVGGSALFEALSNMAALGIEAKVAEGAITAIGRAATASGASANELAKSFQSAWQHLGLQPGDAERFFSSMHQAGKMGGFELKDMAEFFPAAFANLGNLYGGYMKSLPDDAARSAFAMKKASEVATWAQIVRLGAADARTAGTNLMNIYQKNMIEETSKHFEKHLGINFRDQLFKHTSKGGDPVEWVTWQLAEYIKKKGNNPLYLGQLFADKQAMEGYIPLVAAYMNKWGQLAEFMKSVREAADKGVISRDFLTAIETLSYKFTHLKNSVEELFATITEYGGKQSLGWVFSLAGDGLFGLVQWLQKHPGVTEPLIRLGMGFASLLGGLTLLRFAGAGATWFFARSGMGLIGILSAIPGLGVALGALGGVLGWIGKLGLIGGAGFLLWQNWSKLKSMMSGDYDEMGRYHKGPVDYLADGLTRVQEVLGRLGQLFPSLSTGLGGFSDIIKGLVPDLGKLQQIGSDLMAGFGWLFTGQGDSAGFTRAKDGIAGMIANVPGLQALGDWAKRYRADLAGENGIFTMLGAWARGAGVGFLGITGFMTARHGLNGLILALMGARTALFVVGTAFAAIAAVMSFLGMFMAPLLERLFELKGAGTVIGRLLGTLGLLALGLWKFGFAGMSSLWTGFVEGIKSKAGAAFNELRTQFSRLWAAIFGSDLNAGEFAYWIADLTGNLNSIGRMIGNVLRPAFQALGAAAKWAADQLEAWRRYSPATFDFVTGWAGKILVGAAAIAFLGGTLRAAYVAASWLVGALWRLSGIPALARFGLGAGSVISGMLAGGALSRLMTVFRTGGLGGVMARGALLGSGPIGFFFMLAGAIYLVLTNLDLLQLKWAAMSDWMASSWLGQFYGKMLGIMERKPGEPPPPTTPLDPYMLPPGFSLQSFESAIGSAGRSAGNNITDAGAEAANALRAAAIAMMAAVEMMRAAVGAGALGSSIDGALSDQGRV